MALPDYSQLYGMGSMLPEMNRRQVQRQRKQGRRDLQQSRRQDRRAARNTTTTPVAGTSGPTDLTLPEPLPPNSGPVGTSASGNLDHPYFDPQSSYVPPGTLGEVVDWSSTAGSPNSSTWGNQYGTTGSPEGYYFGILNQQGMGGFDARSRTAQAMYGDYARGYQAAKMKNSELMFPQYMQMQDIPTLISMLSDEQLGLDRGRQRGALNWTMRG